MIMIDGRGNALLMMASIDLIEKFVQKSFICRLHALHQALENIPLVG